VWKVTEKPTITNMAKMRIFKVISETFNIEDKISVKEKVKFSPFAPGINVGKQKNSSTLS
jgi:hypothetical protein